MKRLPGISGSRNRGMTDYTDDIGRIGNEDLDFYRTLDDDTAEFFLEFYTDAQTNKGDTEWGQERKRAARRDAFNKGKRLSMDFLDSQPLISWENAIINAIDTERFASEKDDIEPGIIKKGQYYQCSLFTPDKTLRAHFADLVSAREWMLRAKTAYNKVAK